MTPHGTEYDVTSCPALPAFPATGKCSIRNHVEGVTYPTRHVMNEGRIPVDVPICYESLDYVIKGGLNARTWFAFPNKLRQIKFDVRFWSDRVPVKLVLQFRGSPDFQDAGIDLVISNHVLRDSFIAMSELKIGHTPFVTALQRSFAGKSKYMNQVNRYLLVS